MRLSPQLLWVDSDSPLRLFIISKAYCNIDMICFTYSIADAMMYSRGQRTDRYPYLLSYLTFSFHLPAALYTYKGGYHYEKHVYYIRCPGCYDFVHLYRRIKINSTYITQKSQRTAACGSPFIVYMKVRC